MNDMISSNKKLTLYASIAWILTILALIFRLLSRLLAYDEGIGYFESGALLPTVYRILTVLLTLHALSALILFRKQEFPSEILSEMAEPHVAEKVASMIASIAMLVSVVASLLIYWVNPIVEASPLQILGVVTAALSVFFFLFFWTPSHRGKSIHILLGYALLIHVLSILCASYFELFTPMNNPVKILLQLCAVGAVLFLLGDLRFFLNSAKPSYFLASATASIGFSSISVLSGGFFTLPSEEYTIVYHVYNLVLFALLIYATVRTVRFLSLCRQAEDALLSKDEEHESAESEEDGTEINAEDESVSDSLTGSGEDAESKSLTVESESDNTIPATTDEENTHQDTKS